MKKKNIIGENEEIKIHKTNGFTKKKIKYKRFYWNQINIASERTSERVTVAVAVEYGDTYKRTFYYKGTSTNIVYSLFVFFHRVKNNEGNMLFISLFFFSYTFIGMNQSGHSDTCDYSVEIRVFVHWQHLVYIHVCFRTNGLCVCTSQTVRTMCVSHSITLCYGHSMSRGQKSKAEIFFKGSLWFRSINNNNKNYEIFIDFCSVFSFTDKRSRHTTDHSLFKSNIIIMIMMIKTIA